MITLHPRATGRANAAQQVLALGLLQVSKMGAEQSAQQRARERRKPNDFSHHFVVEVVEATGVPLSAVLGRSRDPLVTVWLRSADGTQRSRTVSTPYRLGTEHPVWHAYCDLGIEPDPTDVLRVQLLDHTFILPGPAGSELVGGFMKEVSAPLLCRWALNQLLPG